MSPTVAWFTGNPAECGFHHREKIKEIAFKIFDRSAPNAISLEPQCIHRDLNYDADQISRIVAYYDHTINGNAFAYIDEAWGSRTNDRFACHYNKKASRLNSKFFQPWTNGANAFKQDWAYETNWLCPPVYLTVKVINHMRICKATGALKALISILD